MDADFEYTVVELPDGGQGLSRMEQAQTERLNKVADYGWRLVALTNPAGSRIFAYFERPAGHGDRRG